MSSQNPWRIAGKLAANRCGLKNCCWTLGQAGEVRTAQMTRPKKIRVEKNAMSAARAPSSRRLGGGPGLTGPPLPTVVGSVTVN